MDDNNKRKAQANQLAEVELAYAAHKRMGGTVPTIEADANIPGTVEPDMMEEGETAEQALARIVAEGGDDDGVVMTDGLDDMSRNELFQVIATEELPIKKQGKAVDLVPAIRAARSAKAAASVDPGTDIPDLEEDEGGDGVPSIAPAAPPESE